MNSGTTSTEAMPEQGPHKKDKVEYKGHTLCSHTLEKKNPKNQTPKLKLCVKPIQKYPFGGSRTGWTPFLLLLQKYALLGL